jgi:hypothetical protein
MFENSSVMILKGGNSSDEVLRIELDDETQKAIGKSFSEALENMITDKEKVIFDGSYRPNEDEYLAIENFQLSDEIKDAIRDPLGVQGFQKEGDNYPEIKAIFIGEREENQEGEVFKVAFQRFRKEQYISTRGFNLFFSNNTFMQEKRYGINISEGIDCYVIDRELQFSSFYYARQVFELSEYYRSATDSEVQTFSTNQGLHIEDTEAFKKMANTVIRRKIAMINDSQVLDQYSASEIKKKARAIGVDVEIKDKKVVIPNDKEKIKVILGFLDEEAYKGPFSQNTYLANSKRKVEH